jgi:signal transduction histidine kinase
MAGRLQERSDYIRSFASHVSHELKSPLTAISGAAELLRDQGAAMSDSERARFAANIAEDAVRLDRLVARLRDHARAETAIAGSEATRLADAVASMAAPEGIAIEMRIPTDMSVAMSAETIGIVLANLADNAASHGTKTLTFAARAADGRATITVSDDGTGISPGNRGRVFEPFFTTRREEGGTGMGLHIVKTLIEAHGGSIRLLDVAKGAAFEITLPLGA